MNHWPELYRRIGEELNRLPGEEAHIEMFPQRARSSEAIQKATGYRACGVMGLFYPEEEGHRMIVIERQDYDGKHSGQIGLPGGKKEERDADELAAALRETFEEIGIDPVRVQVLGKLTNVYIPVSNFLVHPFLGFLQEKPEFVIDRREVKNVLSFEIGELLKAENRILTSILVSKGSTLKNVPAFSIDGKIIWGATALMLNELKVILGRISWGVQPTRP